LRLKPAAQEKLSRFEWTGQRLPVVIPFSGLIRRLEHGG
jgi:hypothetical protein